MVDFRKYWPGLAVIALAFGAALPATAAAVESFTCVANAGNVPTVVAQTIDQIVEENGNTNNTCAFISDGVVDNIANHVAISNLENDKIDLVTAAFARFIASNPGFGQKVVVAIAPLSGNLGHAGLVGSTPARVNPFAIAGYGIANNVGMFVPVDTPGKNSTRVIGMNNSAINGAVARATYHPAFADHPAKGAAIRVT